MDKIQALFESYNYAAEEGYNKAFEGRTPDAILKMKEAETDKYLRASFEEWPDKPISKNEDLTPRQIISDISDLNEAIEYFKTGSIICDKDLPEVLLNKIKSFGEAAEQELIRMASDIHFINDDKNIYISVMALRIIGKWKLDNALPDILKTMDYSDNKEIILEEATDAIIDLGDSTTDYLIKRLETAKEINFVDEYILTALVKVCKNNKSDRVLECVKNVFNKMEDKLLGAMCIGDYGDWRAITMLRGFIKKCGDGLEKEVYMEIKAVIKRLGGDISDI